MSNIVLNWCDECSTYHLQDPPVHYPAFTVCTADEDIGNPRVIRAANARHAALKYAERWDAGDYTIALGSPTDFSATDESGRREVVTVRACKGTTYVAEDMP